MSKRVIRPDRMLMASGNQHKLREVGEILAPYGTKVVNPDAVGGLPEVIEDGDTFAANAIKKAVSACQHTGLWCIADDSGIEALALGGVPGVYSARYAGPACDDQANNAKLDAALREHDDKRVQYRCVIALARPDAEPLTWDGTFAGEWTHQPAGVGGFGYDPYVMVPDVGCTVAEMSSEDKHARSHRGQALRAWLAWLAEHTQGDN